MALCESSNRRMKKKRQYKIVLFSSANASGVGGTNSKALKPSAPNTRHGDPDTTVLELLKLEHDRVDLNADSEGSMFVFDNEM